MHDHTQRSDGRPLDELEGALREGVESVRGESVPQQALRRSLDRARALNRPRFQPRQRSRTLLAASALAATLLLGLFLLWPSSSDTDQGDRVGHARHNAEGLNPRKELDVNLINELDVSLPGPTSFLEPIFKKEFAKGQARVTEETRRLIGKGELSPPIDFPPSARWGERERSRGRGDDPPLTVPPPPGSGQGQGSAPVKDDDEGDGLLGDV